MFLKFLTPGDVLKDTGFAAFGFSPAVLVMETGLLLGLLNLLVVVAFRVVELYLRERRARRKGGDEAD